MLTSANEFAAYMNLRDAVEALHLANHAHSGSARVYHRGQFEKLLRVGLANLGYVPVEKAAIDEEGAA